MSNIDLQSLKETDPDACQDGGDMMTYFDAWSWPIYNPCRSTKGLADAGNVFCIRMDGERGCFAFGPPYGFDLVAVRQGINDYWTPKECGIVCYDPKKATQVLDRALVERLGAGLSGPNLNITALNTQLNTEALVALKREVLGRYPLDPECSVGCEGCLGDSSEDAVNQLLKCFCDYVSVHCDGIDNEGLDTPMASSNAGFNTTVGQVLSQLQGPKDSKRVDSCLVECRRAQQ
ncbi:hypothetical protein GNI_191070 [Gregarina niphandrodes]|uniref:Uncharacterized protein n=1 Tax=Gregarina niphandrodes TaxID=110365 RepID=A0A023AXN3_GRENI|nr:hypothetical protein GNI_191070 [Gregarina niphandrodes]EZG43060.1 hypothetical protein GNI_191070 [Gregarina niphandrodes]|eukprot:XP_011133668.1 hypothetical protein GNI_191070 [Gregarina niphandrodes]